MSRSTLVLYVSGDHDDLEFLRARAHGVLVDLVDEYEANLDGDVDVSWEWNE